ncbi:UxaA family hydrolase [Thermodesulfobacteriota bacterium]
MSDIGEFIGYRRPDGQVGVRNRLAVISAMDNANPVARRIAGLVRNAVSITAPFGRGQVAEDRQRHDGTLIGLGNNPNFGANLIISLEGTSAHELAEGIAQSGKPVETVNIQEAGGTLRATEEGVRSALKLMSEIGCARREPVPLMELVVGVECGGSDTTSGFSANPVTGLVGDTVVQAGGTWILSETEEITGAEHSLIARAASKGVADAMGAAIKNAEALAEYNGVQLWPMGPDNIAGGLTTVEEKALGGVHKGGSTSLNEVVKFGKKPAKKGLIFMDAPAPGTENITALSAGGAQIIIFTTGVGNPVGSGVSPTIKVCGNPKTVIHFGDNIDVDLSGVTKGEQTLREAADILLKELVDVACGKMTRNEILGDFELAISPVDIGFLRHGHKY